MKPIHFSSLATPFISHRATAIAESMKRLLRITSSVLNWGYWNEEVYVSLLEAGHLKSALERPFDEVIDMYLAASKVVPHRAESFHAASRFCRLKGRFAEGYEFAKQGLQISRPETGLFIQSWVYDYGLLDELAVNAYWCGKYLDCYNACLKLLADNRAPADYRGRIQDNADFALEKLKELTSSLEESPVIELPSRRDLPCFNICLVSIDKHFPIFEQIIRALQGALNDLNYFCSVKHNALEKGAINIVIGSTAFAARDPARLQFLEHHPFIIYQMEQLGDQPFLDIARKEYFSLLEKASHILEYSPSQLGFLRSTSLAPRPVCCLRVFIAHLKFSVPKRFGTSMFFFTRRTLRAEIN